MPRVVAIVPARNEHDRVGAAVTALAGIADEVLVVDDGSTDATDEEARRAGARVIRRQGRGDKGAALAAGCAAARSADILLFADADLGSTAAKLAAILEPVLLGDADIAIAAPAPGSPSGLGLVEGLSRWAIRRLTGRWMSRPLSGQRAIRASILPRVRFAAGFGVETAMTIDALRQGFSVVEVPCEFEHARTGRTISGFVHRLRQGIDIVAALVPRLVGR